MAENKGFTNPREHRQLGHERLDVNVRAVALFGGGMLVFIGGILLWMAGMFEYFAGRPAKPVMPPSPLAISRQLPPEPRLQVDPARDLQDMRAQEDAVLNSYGWVDRKAGIVRLPIHRAIDLLAERGLPARPEGKGG